MMLFREAFETYIKNQAVSDCGFRLLQRIEQPNGYFAEIGGYFVQCSNGYSMVFSGASLHKAAIQEALILDPNYIIVAKDTEDLR